MAKDPRDMFKKTKKNAGNGKVVKLNTLADRPELREAMLEELRAGAKQVEVAQKYGVSPPTVHRLVKEEGFDVRDNKRVVWRETFIDALNRFLAQEVIDFDLVNRVKLGNIGFMALYDMVPEISTLQAMREWWVAYGIAVDKRRLEDGEATSRSEMANASVARETITGKLDQLAKAREARLQKLALKRESQQEVN